ncbi:MAG: imidazole glycerol phosphate synthase subunit HisF [Flavobacteriaceae bacterium]|jgi:imidazole glycerol-phosphate synthase subunit HisF|nr:imidazole glycerol phosphate synthase subunit HisF [Candidatus Neomarinimicrobiota bacterium]MBT5772533.1 imidazole glycerol phosphate synthase subunit HisF [Flavobacteriaceae bacterium]MBT6448446.1 imidazole glycerol phosphate synthase subunit HisF [Flavobacteriaceae bacterium]
MLKVRIIPVLTFNGISLVKTKQFSNPRIVGNPIQAAKVYNSRNVDELVFVDINATKQNRKINLPVVKKVIDECFMPVTIGGGIKTLDDINNLLRIGADKVLIKTMALNNLNFIVEAVKYFGSQCISIAVDVIKHESARYIFDRNDNKILLEQFMNDINKCEVGEIILTSVNEDGMMQGYDLELINTVVNMTKVPVVSLGGAGKLSHFEELAARGYDGAYAAASIYHFTQYTPREVKLILKNSNIPVRL